ncbi:MAG: hypothetical protein LBV55_02530 [Acholeplasmatales bacterium]|jgi:hypothetical protein|nr:hypothetical protein [Acholeplasmatales bacterium]
MKRIILLFVLSLTLSLIAFGCKPATPPPPPPPPPPVYSNYVITYLVKYPDDGNYFTYKSVLYNTANPFNFETGPDDQGNYYFNGWSASPEGTILPTTYQVTSDLNLYGWYSLDLPDFALEIGDILSWFEINYSYAFETGWTYGNFLVTEHGMLDAIANDSTNPNGLTRDYRDVMHYSYLEGSTIHFFRGNEFGFASYNERYNLATFNEYNIYNQLIFNDDDNYVTINLNGEFNYDGSFSYEKNIASFFARLILGDELGYCRAIEIEFVDDTLIVYGIAKEAFSFLELPGVLSPSGKPVIFTSEFNDIDTTEIGPFTEFYLSNTIPVYGDLGNWDDLLSVLNQQMYVVLNEDVEDAYLALVSVLPSIPGELDFDYYSEPDSVYYFSRISFAIFNKTESDLALFVQQAFPLSMGIDDEWGLYLVNDPIKIYLLPYYNQSDQILVMNFYFQHYGLWPELQVNNLIHNTFPDIDVPPLLGAVRYYFSSNFTGNYVVAYLEAGQSPQAMVETWIAYLLNNHGYLRVMTNQGEQIQDPSKRIALYFQTFNDFGPEVMIDFMLASPGAEIGWPITQLNDLGLNIIPECDGQFYSIGYQSVIDAWLISVINPNIGFYEYQALLTSLGFTRVFEDPAWSTMYSFLAPDGIHQVTVSNRTFEGQYWITIYDRVSSPLVYTSYIPSSLNTLIGPNYLDIPFAQGAGASYSLINSYLIFGQGMEDVPSNLRYNVWGIYSINLTPEEITTFYANFIAGGWARGEFGMYYSDQYPGLGINYIDFLDGSILVGGANYYYGYSNANAAISAAIAAFLLKYPTYSTQINDISDAFPSLPNNSYQTTLTYIYGSPQGSEQMEIAITGINNTTATTFRNELFANYSFQPLPNNRYQGALWSQRGYANISGGTIWFDITLAYFSNVLYIYIRN